MKEKQQLRAPAPPIFGIFNPTTIGQIPFEVERRVERAKFEMELDLVEERKRSLAELNSKLKLGAEIHLQEQRELIIQRSRLLAENPPIFNRTVYYVIQEAEKMFEVPLDRAHDMFERFDAAEEMLSQEKRAQIRELVISFLQKYKDDLDETVQKDVSAERKRRLEAATSDAVHIAAHWEEVTRHDADALNETHLQDAKLQLECQREASFETTINHCSAAGSAVRHETATPNAFDIIGFSGNSDYALFKNRLFKPDSFFQKAMK